MENVTKMVSGDLQQWWPLLGTLGHVLLIALLAWGALRLARNGMKSFRLFLGGRSANAEEMKRIETLGRVFRYIANVFITLVAGMLILGELGISIAPILGAAGVVGIAVGFGAQSLVKDYFVGFFLLLEDQIRVGDVVTAGDKAGLVEEMTLRYLRLRDYEGNVHYVPNGLVTTVTNKSRGFAYAVVDIGIAYRESIDEALTAIREVCDRVRRSEKFAAKIIDDVDIAGVEALADSSVILRCRVKVLPLEQWSVRRELLRCFKEEFDARGIEIPYPHVTLYAGQAKTGGAPALRVTQVAEAAGTNGSTAQP